MSKRSERSEMDAGYLDNASLPQIIGWIDDPAELERLNKHHRDGHPVHEEIDQGELNEALLRAALRHVKRRVFMMPCETQGEHCFQTQPIDYRCVACKLRDDLEGIPE